MEGFVPVQAARTTLPTRAFTVVESQEGRLGGSKSNG